MNFFMIKLLRDFPSLWSFWSGYFQLMAFLSVLLHIALFKHELDKTSPSILYEQEFP